MSIHCRRVSGLALLACAMVPTASLTAQNFDHPGEVLAGRGKWLPVAEARSKGFFRFGSRWLPRKHRKAVDALERRGGRHLPWEKAYETRSRHYRIQTNLPRFLVEDEIKPFLDSLFATYVEVFQREFGVRQGKRADKKGFRIYYGLEDFYEHEERTGTALSLGQNGVYLPDIEVLVVPYEETDPARFVSTTFHEGVHQFLAAVFTEAGFPQWLEEGLATCFEGCVYSRATRAVHVDFMSPARLPLAQSALRAAPLPSDRGLAEALLFDIPRDSFGAEQYALAWSFTYYLMHREGGARRAAFRRFLDALRRTETRDPAEVFRRACGENFRSVQAGWRAFVLALDPGPRPAWVVLDVTGVAPSENLRRGDRIYSLDDIEIHSAAQFKDLWEKRPKDRPCEITVVRHLPAESRVATVPYRALYASTSIRPDSRLTLRAAREVFRYHNLRD